MRPAIVLLLASLAPQACGVAGEHPATATTGAVWVASCEAIALLDQRMKEHVRELDHLQRLYTPNYPDVVAKKKEIAAVASMRAREVARARAQNLRCAQDEPEPDRESRIVDLNTPGALDHVKHDNPAHYPVIRGILASVGTKPEAQSPAWLSVTYKAEDVALGQLLLTTDPPKTDLSFRLDEVVYQARVTLPHVSATPGPAGVTRQQRPR